MKERGRILLLAVVWNVAMAPTASPPARASAPRVQPERPVTAANQFLEPANNSPALMADPTHPDFVVMASRLDAPDLSCLLHVSGDAGRGWLPVRPVFDLPAGAEKCYAPEVDFGPDGMLYYFFVGLGGPGNQPTGVFFVTSADRAQTFSKPRQVLGPLNFGVRLAVDRRAGERGRIHLAWLHATSDPSVGGLGEPPNPIMASHSDDGGRTFSSPVKVSDANRTRVVAPALVLDPGRAVHIAYYDLKDDAIDYQGLQGGVWEHSWSIVLTTSRDGGETFGAGSVVEDGVVPHERVMLVFTMPPPALAVTHRRICVAWPDARRGDADVLLRCRGLEERAWGPAVRVNDSPEGDGTSQYLPRLASTSAGRLDVIFYDRRDDPENAHNHVYYSSSSDGGRTFSANTRLTSDPSDARVGQRYVHPAAQGLVEFGSRLGLISGNNNVLAAWADTRNSRPGTSQDIFATKIDLPRDPSYDADRPLLMVVVGGLGILVAASVLTYRRRNPAAAPKAA